MRFIGYKDDLIIFKILDGQAVFLGEVQIQMKLLCRRKAEINSFGVAVCEVLYFTDRYMVSIQGRRFGKQVFTRCRIQKIFLCLFQNIRLIDEKEKIAIALCVEIENKTRHDDRLTATGCHMKEGMKLLILS